MDFSFSDEQKALRDRIIRFAQAELNDGIAQRDKDQSFARHLWLKCGEVKLQGLAVPQEYGGLGLDPLTCAIALEAFGYGCHDGGLVFSVGAHLLACAVPIWKHGAEEQKRRYLPGLCNGTLIGGNALSEPNTGSDAFSLRTTAERDGDGFRLNGSKMFITNGPVANLAITFAVTDSSKGYHGGISAFLLETKTKGVEVGPCLEKMGLCTAPLGGLVLKDVRLPADAVLGGVGAGTAVFSTAMDWERICLFACHVGTMQRLLEQSITYARTRKQFGQPIGKFQAIAHRIADAKAQLEAARLLVYQAAWRLDRAKNVALDASLAKLFVSESYVQTTLAALQIHGGYGYLRDHGVERIHRDAMASTLYSGTSEMQRTIIARWLGL